VSELNATVRGGWSLPSLDDAGRLTVATPPQLCAAGGLLFGGWTMALASEVARLRTGLRVRSQSFQFIAPVLAGQRIELTTEVVHAGRRVSHCAVSARVDGRIAFTSQLVMGGSALPGARSWLPAPTGPDPDSCPPRSYRYRVPDSAMDTMDVRLAGPEPAPGQEEGARVLLWARVLADAEPEAKLAVLSDHVPYLIVRSLAGVRHATSTAAALRVTGAALTDWTLLEVELHAADAEYCLGSVRQWSQDGVLLAAAEQTAYLRFG
jgi:acyl-CoA thioesterase